MQIIVYVNSTLNPFMTYRVHAGVLDLNISHNSFFLTEKGGVNMQVLKPNLFQCKFCFSESEIKFVEH